MAQIQELTIGQLIEKYKAATAPSWKGRYGRNLKERKPEVISYFNSLSSTEEQHLYPVLKAFLES